MQHLGEIQMGLNYLPTSERLTIRVLSCTNIQINKSHAQEVTGETTAALVAITLNLVMAKNFIVTIWYPQKFELLFNLHDRTRLPNAALPRRQACQTQEIDTQSGGHDEPEFR